MSAVVKLRHKKEIYNERVVKKCMRNGKKLRCTALRYGQLDIVHLKTYGFGLNAKKEEHEVYFSFPSLQISEKPLFLFGIEIVVFHLTSINGVSL